MKSHTPAGFFVIRTPLLPWGVTEWWGADLSNKDPSASDAELEAALDADLRLIRARLRELVRQPVIREALFVASPSLDARLSKWLEGEPGGGADGVEPAVMRYLMRMAGRATPFGLFAANGVGRVAATTNLAVPTLRTARKHTRLDMDYVFRLCEALSADPAVRPDLRYTANGSKYELNGRIRYLEARVGKKQRTYHLVDVARTPYLAVAMDVASRPGGATTGEISRALMEAFPAVTREAATGYVDDLIASHLLCSPLVPTVTGDKPTTRLLHALEGLSAATGVAETIGAVVSSLHDLDVEGVGTSPSAYAAIAERLAPLPVEVDISRLFHVDLHRTGIEATLSHSVVDEVRRGVDLLYALSHHAPNPLDAFARAFEARYEGREVPLLEALDEESGVGFDAPPAGTDPSPLLDNIPIFEKDEPASVWHKRQRRLLHKIELAALTGAMEVDLTDADVEVMSTTKSRPLPPAFATMVTIDAPSPEAVLRGDYRLFIRGLTGPGAGGPMGRFCHGDPVLAELTTNAIGDEDAYDPDAIHAEIAHLPQGRIGNISCRPMLRRFDVPIVGGSGASQDRQIELGDLLLSFRGGRFQLRSRRLGKRVVVHLSSAHNVRTGGLAVYRFLAQMYQNDYQDAIGWSWGPLESALFLPRLVRGRLILSPAKWTLDGELLAALVRTSGVARWRIVQGMRSTLRMPRHVRLADEDNMLPIDLDNIVSLESFFSVLSIREKIVLTEALPQSDRLIARGPDGAFCHELLIPFASPPLERAPSPAASPPEAAPSPIVVAGPRSRRPGGDWLYLKLYCGTSALDKILRDHVAPLVRDLRAGGLISRWFFVRYRDPEWHVRLRFRGDPTTLLRDVMPFTFESLKKADALSHRLAVDTYEPEVERYGGERALAIAEEVFEADSDAALEVLAACQGDGDARWRACVLGMNALLSDLSFSHDVKQELLSIARDGEMTRFWDNVGTTRAIGGKYRLLRTELETLLENPAPRYAPTVSALGRRSAALVGPLARLRELEENGELVQERRWIGLSYLHMWANRVCKGSANEQELVMYDFLSRYYEGKLARARRPSGREIHP